jgi:hypothetical protein
MFAGGYPAAETGHSLDAVIPRRVPAQEPAKLNHRQSRLQEVVNERQKR